MNIDIRRATIDMQIERESRHEGLYILAQQHHLRRDSRTGAR